MNLIQDKDVSECFFGVKNHRLKQDFYCINVIISIGLFMRLFERRKHRYKALKMSEQHGNV
jgi:hypothetical protein